LSRPSPCTVNLSGRVEVPTSLKPPPPGQARLGGGVALSDPAATVIGKRRFRFHPGLASPRRGKFGTLSNARRAATLRGCRTRVSQTSCGSHPIGWAASKIGASCLVRSRTTAVALAFMASVQLTGRPCSCSLVSDRAVPRSPSAGWPSAEGGPTSMHVARTNFMSGHGPSLAEMRPPVGNTRHIELAKGNGPQGPPPPAAKPATIPRGRERA
jgi:hypothetical protein